MRAATLVVAGLISAQAASAADLTKSVSGTSYFHKTGATAASHEADLRDCRLLAGKVHQPPGPEQQMVYGGSLAGAIAVVLISAAVASSQDLAGDRRSRPVNVENCM